MLAAMRNPGLTVVLVLLALVPMAAWGLAVWGWALTLEYPAPVTAPRAPYYFQQLVLLLTPALIGGILMVAGAALLARRPLGARVAATVGLALIMLTAAAFIAFEARDPGPGYEALIAATLFLLPHAGVVVWLWRSRRRPAV